jgi:hypothetical protein
MNFELATVTRKQAAVLVKKLANPKSYLTKGEKVSLNSFKQKIWVHAGCPKVHFGFFNS